MLPFSTNMGDLIPTDDFERAMASLFPPAGGNTSRFADSDIDKISRLLVQVGKLEWSVRPRTYAVLRLIGRVDIFEVFISDSLKSRRFAIGGK